MIARARIQTRGGGSEELIKVKECETAPPRRTCTAAAAAAAAARPRGKAGLELSCTIQATSQSDLIADVDAGRLSSARFIFLLLPSGPEADY